MLKKGSAMDIGFIGLGKMGMNMVTRLRRDQHRVVVYDRAPELIKQAEKQGCIGASSLNDVAAKLSALSASPPRRCRLASTYLACASLMIRQRCARSGWW